MITGWKHTTLGKHIDLLTGFPFKSELYSESDMDIRLLRGDNVCQGYIRWEDARKWPVAKTDGLERYWLKEGDVVIAMDRTWVKSGLKCSPIKSGDIPSLLVQRVARLRGANGLISQYLNHLVQSHKFSQYVKGVQTETAVPHISPDQIREYPIILPTEEEQKKIASSIDSWDHSTDLTERLITAKQERRTWLMQQLLTGKRRLPGFDGEWKETHIRDIFKPVRRKNDKGVTHVLTASGEHGLVDQTEYFNRSVSGESLDGYYLLRRGEFAYNRSSMNGYPYGAIKRLDAYDEGVLSTLYLCFKLSSENCHSDFYKHLFEAGVLNEQLRKIVQVGARAHGLLNVTLHDFFALKLMCPPIDEQKAIASTIDVAEREIDLLRAQLDGLREQKKGLMQQLLTGKVRVKI